jgi:hypothetical protein
MSRHPVSISVTLASGTWELRLIRHGRVAAVCLDPNSFVV